MTDRPIVKASFATRQAAQHLTSLLTCISHTVKVVLFDNVSNNDNTFKTVGSLEVHIKFNNLWCSKEKTKILNPKTCCLIVY